MAKYIPPALRQKLAEYPGPEMMERTYRQAEIHMHFGYTADGEPEALLIHEAEANDADDEEDGKKTDKRIPSKLRNRGTLNASKADQDKLAYIILFRGANPFWTSKNEIFCKSNLDLLPDPASLCGEPNTSDGTYATSYPVFIQTKISGQVGGHLKFAGYYGIQSIQYLAPRSKEVAELLEVKFANRDRDRDKWMSSFNARWAVVTLGLDKSGKEPPAIKTVKRSVNEILTALRSKDTDRDSLEEPRYTQAPPSYQEAPDPMMGVPRDEDDNVPDDFKFGGSVAEATLPIRMQFIRKVYSILTVQLLVTAALSGVSFFNNSYRRWVQANSWMMFVSVIGALVFMLLTYWKRKSYPSNLLFLSAFTLLEGYAISVVTSFYDSAIVMQALVLTLGIFLALTLFACQTKYDFTSWIPYLFGALWFLVLFGFMSMFFQMGSKMELVYGAIGALIFSGYILVDTQLVMRHHHVEEEIAASISLYLDVINLFLAILRILNSQSNN
ncbi:conserved hypothetical protein [Uncinocarpus reesii 1704]|uniref:Transmembrane BAX inhibitor motif-containing protein 4 n=1 Tax=Uncinocarpus reesii (strain UAMH 1704) TaxID=336963 RepID=C4JLP9_UNCRE|nr:uncharacterized protein UREG_03757 [Uncinocarpus reesii 1704]EEP78911.1 conserved hypothetical protein [Uncinocarpus reesii 1704]